MVGLAIRYYPYLHTAQSAKNQARKMAAFLFLKIFEKRNDESTP